MNMGSLRAELAFPASYAAQPELDRRDNGGAVGGHHADDDSDDDDGDFDEDVMILGSTPQVRVLRPRILRDRFPVTRPACEWREAAYSAYVGARGSPNHTPQGLGDGGAGAWRRPPVGAAVGASGLGFGSERFDNGQPALRVQHVRVSLVWWTIYGASSVQCVCNLHTWVCCTRLIPVQPLTKRAVRLCGCEAKHGQSLRHTASCAAC